jgi:putative ABC transport system permease protein
MSFAYLIWAGLRRRPMRSVLNGLAIAVAFLLFGMMHGVVASLDTTIANLSNSRIHIVGRAGDAVRLPLAYRERIESVEGVTSAMPSDWPGTYYQNQSQWFPISGTDLRKFLAAFPEMDLPNDQREALLKTRDGIAIGSKIAARFNLKLGDTLPMTSIAWTNHDGTKNWPFKIVAIHNTNPKSDQVFADRAYFHYAYLDDGRVEENGTTMRFIATINDRSDLEEVAKRIDDAFANSSYETKSMSEKQFIAQGIQELGNLNLFVNSILGSVVFALLVMSSTTMIQSVRERTSEFGVLKSLGFTGGAVFRIVLAESVVLSVISAAVGLALAGRVFPAVLNVIGMQSLPLPADIYVEGFGSALVIALAVAAWPAWCARRLSIVEAISGR